MKPDEDLGMALLLRLGVPFFADALFDEVPDTVYFVKDAAGRYVAVNRTLAERCGLKGKQGLIGRTAADVFPASLGQHYAAQDEAVLRKGRSVRKALELHLYPDGTEGWCLTWKEPLRDGSGHIVGLVGLSRDIDPSRGVPHDFGGLARVLAHVRKHIDRPLRIGALAKLAGLSAYQLNRRMTALFGMSAKKLVAQERIEHACALLRSGGTAISRIALECGYADQAAFTRHFKKTVGITPTSYIKASKSGSSHGPAQKRKKAPSRS